MSVDNDLAALADLCGILPKYYDLHGGERITSPATQKALLAANGIDVADDAAIHRSLVARRHQIEDRWFPEEIIVESGVAAPQNFGLGAVWQIRPDGSDDVIAEGSPSDHITIPPLSSGIYDLTATASGRTEMVTVLAAPKRLPSVESLTGASRLWGMNLALYGVRSGRNTGLGDFEDLAGVAEVAGGQGASFIGINPLHNMGHSDFNAISPYSPSHRGYLNTEYIALDNIPGLAQNPRLAAFDKIKQAEAVQYNAHKTAHHEMLEQMFVLFGKNASKAAKASFDSYKKDCGPGLQEFATFEALSEIYGPVWQDWPGDPDPAPAPRVAFHMWLQWVATTQLNDAQGRAKMAGMPLGLYLDLAVGSRRDGAESWCEQSAIAQGVSIGAPPDHLSPAGQNWNLAAFSPIKLRAQRYRPLRRILAQTIRHAGIIRIDHVLGLNRSFWVPDDGSPGAYIHQPFESLLAVIKIAAERYNCAVVGEDLGLVPDGFRDTMRDHGFYGYSVLQYEKDDQGAFRDPKDSPAQVLSCFATHDTPTVKGYSIANDVDWWERLDWINPQTAKDIRQKRLAEIAGFTSGADFQTQINEMLAHSNAGLVAVQLDDVLGSTEAQNLPGTIDEHPNWRRRYDIALENLSNDQRLHDVASLMKDAGRSIAQKGESHEV